MLERSKALQIYFKPGLKEDDVMLRVWQAAKRSGRPQEIFRDMLREGLVALVANGTMPESIIEECGLDAIVERRRRRTAKHADRPVPPQPVAQPVPPYGYPAYPHPQYPVPPAYPPQDFPGYGPSTAGQEIASTGPESAPVREPEPPARTERVSIPPGPETAPERTPQAETPSPAAVADPGEDGKPARKLGKLM